MSLIDTKFSVDEVVTLGVNMKLYKGGRPLGCSTTVGLTAGERCCPHLGSSPTGPPQRATLTLKEPGTLLPQPPESNRKRGFFQEAGAAYLFLP